MIRNNVQKAAGAVAAMVLLIAGALFNTSCRPDQLSEAVRMILEVPAPEFSHEGDTYGADINVSVTCGLEGAAIHYTVDGSEPTAESELYTGPIAVAGDGTEVTLRAVSVKEDMQNSPVTSADYIIRYERVAEPVFSLAPGTYDTDISVTISCDTDGAVIYYSDSGYQPDENSPVYDPSNPVTGTGDGTVLDLKAFAIKEGMTDSFLAEGRYTIDYSAVAMPVFSPESGTYNMYNAPSEISISCATEGADIYWQLDEPPYDPSTGVRTGNLYSAPIPVGTDGDYIYFADAIKTGLEPSSLMYVRYTIDTNPPSPPVLSSEPPSPTMDTTPEWTWNEGGGGNGTYRCKFNDADLSTGAVTVSGTSYVPDSPLAEGLYTLRIQERDDAGNWSISEVSAQCEIAFPVPTGPVSPADSGDIIDTSPLLDWDDAGGDDVAAYHLQVNRDAGFGAGTMETDIDTLASSQYSHPPLPGGGTWYWRVRVGNSDGVFGAWSNTWKFTVLCSFDTNPDELGLSGVEDVYTADVNGDSLIDFMGTGVGGELVWWENDGSGTGAFFPDEILSNTFGTSFSVCTGDIDGDDDTDILGASVSIPEIAWWENQGGSVTSGGKHTVPTTLSDIYSVCAADVDADGDTDIVAASMSDNTLAWYRNNGSAVFTEIILTTGISQARSVATADLDADGDADILVSGMGGEIEIWLNNGGGSFSRDNVDSSFGGARSVCAADFDGNGAKDILCAGYSIGEVAWWANDGSGSFGGKNVVDGSFGSVESVFPADLDADGNIDIIGASPGNGEFAWWRNNGDGTFGEKQLLEGGSGTYIGAGAVSAADFDGDGDLEIIGGATGDDLIYIWENLLY